MNRLFNSIRYPVINGLFYSYGLYLNKYRKNLASNLERFPSNHSYGYAFSGDRSTLFATFPLLFVLFMNYSG